LPVNQVKSAKANGSAAKAPALETHRVSRTADLDTDEVTGHSSGDPP